MPSQSVIDAVEARVVANFTRCPLITNNTQGQTPADGSPFLTVQYPVADEEQITIGSPGAQVWRETGAIRFVLSIKRATGVEQGLQWVDELRTLFRGKQFSAVNTYAAPPAVLDDRNDSGNYWTLSFAVPYYFDIIG